MIVYVGLALARLPCRGRDAQRIHPAWSSVWPVDETVSEDAFSSIPEDSGDH